MSNSGIKIFAPACISMHSFGIPDLSIAIDNPGIEIIAHIDENNISSQIDLYSKEKEDVNNTKRVVLDITNGFLKYINSDIGVRLEILNKIPFDSGLGQIEAAITGSVVAINDLLKSHVEKKEIFDFIINKIQEYNLEIIPSNIAANLFGGIILYNKNTANPIQKIYNPHGINFSIILMKRELNDNIFDKINTYHLLKQSSNISLLIKGLMISDLDLISDALKNNELEQFFAKNDILFEKIKEISYKNKVYSTGFSHLGESIIIINPNTLIAEQNNTELVEYLNSQGKIFKIINSKINLNGLYKY